MSINSAECVLDNVSFFNVDKEQAIAIENSGGQCKKNNESIDIQIESCSTNKWNNPSFMATITNNSSYNFDAFSVYFDVYDKSGYGMDERYAFTNGVRPGQTKLYEMEMYWPDEDTCYNIGKMEITEIFISIWGDDRYSLPKNLQNKIESITNIRWMDKYIKLNSNLNINILKNNISKIYDDGNNLNKKKSISHEKTLASLDSAIEQTKTEVTKEITKTTEVKPSMTLDEVDILRNQLHSCLKFPVDNLEIPEEAKIDLKVLVNKDKTIKSIEVLNAHWIGLDPKLNIHAESALRALNSLDCKKLKLPDDKYSVWNEINFTFDFNWLSS